MAITLDEMRARAAAAQAGGAPASRKISEAMGALLAEQSRAKTLQDVRHNNERAELQQKHVEELQQLSHQEQAAAAK